MSTFWAAQAVMLLAAVLLVGMTVPARGDESEKKGEAFKPPPLDAKEWKKQDSGLQIWDVTEGKGEAVKPGATVTIHYTGWLTDGTVFDSSKKRGEPATFPLGNLIKGWQEGIPGMKPGGTRRLMIPYEMAYGEQGRPPVIPPKATLVFEIELLPDPFAVPDVKADAWKKRDNGMRVWDVKVGDGEEVKPGATVTIHYTGWTLDGNVFDSSRKGGRPVTFPLNQLIKGWQEGVPGMKVGGIRRLELPHELAYGERGSPPDIPPKATLLFEIEVKGVQNK